MANKRTATEGKGWFREYPEHALTGKGISLGRTKRKKVRAKNLKDNININIKQNVQQTPSLKDSLQKPIEEAIEQNKQRYLEGPKKNDTNSQIKTTDSLSLFIEANDTSWVKIIIDNKTEEEIILFPKSQKEIAAANNYKIIFGNSGAIELQLNNKPLNFTGTKKEIRYIQIDSSGIQYLNSPPVLE